MLTREHAKSVMAWITPIASIGTFFMWVINMQIEKSVGPIRTEVHSIAVAVEDMKQLTKTMQAEREESASRETILDSRLLNIEERLDFNKKEG